MFTPKGIYTLVVTLVLVGAFAVVAFFINGQQSQIDALKASQSQKPVVTPVVSPTAEPSATPSATVKKVVTVVPVKPVVTVTKGVAK